MIHCWLAGKSEGGGDVGRGDRPEGGPSLACFLRPCLLVSTGGFMSSPFSPAPRQCLEGGPPLLSAQPGPWAKLPQGKFLSAWMSGESLRASSLADVK